MGSLSSPHKPHQVGGHNRKKYSKATQLRVRDFERHALKHKQQLLLCMCLCHANNTVSKKSWYVISDYQANCMLLT